MIRRRVLAAILLVAAATAASAAQGASDWRTLALTSFDDTWQTINDSYPDPAFGGVDWPAVRQELRPRVEAASSPEAARVVIRDMLSRLHRSHFVLISGASTDDSLPGEATVAIDVRVATAGVVVTRVNPGSMAERAGLRPGALILSVDGATAASWMAAAHGDDDRAKQSDAWRRAYRALHGTRGSLASMRVRMPDGIERTFSIPRETEPGEVVQFGNLPPLHVVVEVRELRTPARRRVGFIGFSFWMTAINGRVDSAVERFRKSDGLIFDLRGNPGGLATMMRGIAGHVMTTDALLGTMRTRETRDRPLTFTVNPRTVTSAGRHVTPFAGPVAILVDELTASTSECFAGGLQSLGRVRVFGRQSAGQALPASTKQLANGDVLMYALGDFVTSTGRTIEGAGVVPDESQLLDIAAIAAGRDTTVDAALRWFDTQAGGRR